MSTQTHASFKSPPTASFVNDRDADVDFLKNSLGIVSVPLEGLISLLYWGIKAYDPSLMVPLDPKFHIPLQLDLSL